MPGQPHEWCARHGDAYLTTQEVEWEIGVQGSDLFLRVPAGFRFDVSVPGWLRWAFDPDDPRYLLAAALHDYAIHDLGWGRVSAAAPFSEALRAAGVGRTRRLVMVLAVTIHKWS
jgi:elongation factor P hydroxylase